MSSWRERLAWIAQFVGFTTLVQWTTGGLGLVVAVLVWASGLIADWAWYQQASFLLGVLIVVAGASKSIWDSALYPNVIQRIGVRIGASGSPSITRHAIQARLAHIDTHGLWADDPYLEFELELRSAASTPIHLRGLGSNERITIAGTECQDAPRALRDITLTGPGQFHSFSFRQAIRDSLARRLRKELSGDSLVKGSLAALRFDAAYDRDKRIIPDCWIDVYGSFLIQGPVRKEGTAEVLWPTAPVFINQAVYPGIHLRQH